MARKELLDVMRKRFLGDFTRKREKSGAIKQKNIFEKYGGR